MNLQLYMTKEKTKVLGPLERFAIWVQGCEKRCPGCIAKNAQPLDGGYTKSVDELVAEVLSSPTIEGITISGGEPFLQKEALCELIKGIQSKKDIGVVLYTGYEYREIEKEELTSLCDVVIDGQYIKELDDGRNLRGSSNQNAICITDRYRDYYNQQFGSQGRHNEIVITEESMDLVGIPSKDVLAALLAEMR